MLYEFTLYIGATLVGNWIWEIWVHWSASKEKKLNKVKNCLQMIERCIHELDYNATPGVGGAKCFFKTEGLQALLYSEEVYLLDEALAKSLKNLIIDAGRSNGDAPSVSSYSVKSASKLLKQSLREQSEMLKKNYFSKKELFKKRSKETVFSKSEIA